MDDATALIVAPALTKFTFSSADRGRVERVDLQSQWVFWTRTAMACPTRLRTSSAYWRMIGGDATLDKDGDGFSNLGEYRAGTNPTDPGSLFKFIGISTNAPGGLRIEWSSVAGKSYLIQRSLALETGFTPLVTGIQGTPPRNSY